MDGWLGAYGCTEGCWSVIRVYVGAWGSVTALGMRQVCTERAIPLWMKCGSGLRAQPFQYVTPFYQVMAT